MKLKENRLNSLIEKLITISKPSGVLEVDFELRPYNEKSNEYFLSLRYVVPDGSPFLIRANADMVRKEWNSYLNKTISNYFNIRTLLTQSGITSESFYKQEKERIEQWKN